MALLNLRYALLNFVVHKFTSLIFFSYGKTCYQLKFQSFKALLMLGVGVLRGLLGKELTRYSFNVT